jgi:hypothetical protein
MTSALLRRGAVDARPHLIFFHEPTSGRSRRTEAFLAQVLQRHGNHETFRVSRIAMDERPDLAERLKVRTDATILIAEAGKVIVRLERPALSELQICLAPWLR